MGSIVRYNNIDDMWWGILTRALITGAHVRSRQLSHREIIGYQATLIDIHRNFLLNPRRRLSPTYASAELLWYLSGDDSAEMIRAYAPQYERFAESDGRVHGAYGKRWQYKDGSQLTAAIEALEVDRSTRQCVVCMWNKNDLLQVGIKRDLPCTMTWQFLIRDDRLHMICTMRSNDIWLGMPYDIYVNTTIQKLIAISLNVAVGEYTHQVGSIHLYEKNVAAASETKRFTPPRFKVPLTTSGFDFAEQSRWAVASEVDVRTRNVYNVDGLDHILGDAVTLCAAKWRTITTNQISTLLLRRAYECSS